MAQRTILTVGDEILGKKCKPITKFNERLHILLDDMWETLEAANGVGLAAPQVGVLKRCFIADDGETKLECINPEIISENGEREVLEGCLSVPDRSGYVIRPEECTIRAQNRNGEFFEFHATELMCQCLCHENDHLDGVLYTSKVTRFETEEEREQAREAEENE